MILKRLFGPKWQHPNPQVRLKAVKTIGDRSTLEEILFNDDDFVVLLQALENLYDEDALKRVAREHTDESLRRSAIKRLKTKHYFSLALTETSDEIGQLLLKHIRSAQELSRLVIEAKNESLQHAALQKIKDAKSLTTIATSAPSGDIRSEARDLLKKIEQFTKDFFYAFTESEKCWSCGTPARSKRNLPILQWTCKKCGNGTIITSKTWKKKLKKSKKLKKPFCYACRKQILFETLDENATEYGCSCGAKYQISKSPKWLTQLSKTEYGNCIDKIYLFDYLSKASAPKNDVHQGFNCTQCDAPLELKKNKSHMHTCSFCNASQYISIASSNADASSVNHWYFRMSLPD